MDYSVYTHSQSQSLSRTIGSAGHQRNDSAFSNYSNFSNASNNQRNAYYDDDSSIPRQDCQNCDKCCACVSGACGNASFSATQCTVWTVGSLIFWAILWSFASAFPTQRQFQLRVGETWQLTLPPLWSRYSFEIHTPMIDPGIQVYEFSPVLQGEDAKCPLPTPDPSIKLQSTTSVVLEGNEYKFDYYHLNAGSRITLDLFQGKGSTNIYLLQGYSALNSLQQDSAATVSSYQDFRAKSIVKRFSGPGGETTFTYDVTEPDFYILVYDNASSLPIPSNCMVQLTIERTTHIMPDAKCVCSAKDTQDGGCIWTLTSDRDRWRVQGSCIIIKAVSSTRYFNSSKSAKDDDETNYVQVRLKAKVGSATLAGLALVPLLIGLIFLCREPVSRCVRRPRESQSDEDSSGALRKSSGNYYNYQAVSTNDEVKRSGTGN